MTIIEEHDSQRVSKPLTARKFGVLLVTLGALGLILSYGLAIAKLELIADSSAWLVCDQGGAMRCSPVLASPGAAIFGFPNSFFGMSGFAVVIVVGVLVLARASLPSWFWTWFGIGMAAALVLVVLFEIYSLAGVGVICGDCVLMWLITAIAYFYTRAWQVQEGHVRRPRALGRLIARHRLLVTVIWAGIVLTFVAVRAVIG
ncbi:vitamin K epoxide reductase family protein [Leucobacter sp. GX24907]